MSPSLQTMGFFMSDINFCNTKEQLNHLGEVVTGKVDGSPTGADIDTSTLPYTGQVRKTLPALEEEYQNDIDNFVQVSDQLIVDKTNEFDASIANKEAEADAAIDSYRLLSKGDYAPGILLNNKFEFIGYNGDSYFATNPPYTTTATTPDADGNLFISGYTTFENVANKIGNPNLLLNSNFLSPSPEDITHPNETPTTYAAGTQIFSGVYAGASGATIAITNGRVNCHAGDYQFKVSNVNGLDRVPAFTSSVSDYDGNPTTTGVSHTLVGDEYVVTVTPSAGDVFSVKLEQGDVATKHCAIEQLTSQNSGGIAKYESTSVAGMQSGLTSRGSIAPHVVGDRWSTGNTTWEVVSYTTTTPVSGGLFANPIGDIHVADFGFVFDFFLGGTNDTINPSPSSNDQPIIDALNAGKAKGYVLPNTYTGAGTFFGTKGKLVFPTYPIVIDETKVFDDSYDYIDFNNSVLVPSSTFDLNTKALEITAYIATYDNLSLAMFDNGFKVSNPNLNIGNVRFTNLRAVNVDSLMEIDTRSTTLEVEDYRFDKVREVANILSGDKVSFIGAGWLSAGVFGADLQSHFKLNTEFAPSLHLDDFFYVPTPQTASKCAIVNIGEDGDPALNSGRVYMNKVLSGGEPGRIALVNNFNKGTTGRGTYINIMNSSSFTAGAACVRLFDIPNAVSFSNASGGIEETHTESAIVFDDQFRAFDNAELTMNPGVVPEIWFDGYRFNNFENIPRDNLDTLGKYIRSQNKKFRTYEKGITTTPSSVTIPAAVRFSRGKAWKIKATNLVNPGADRYTEVVAVGDAPGTFISFVTIVQGTTVAPVFSQNAGVLEVSSTSGTQEFAIEIEQLTDATESFL